MTDLAAIRKRHEESQGPWPEAGHVCLSCWQPWPCDAAKLLALLADTPSVEPPCEHEWEDASDDETAWYCPKCDVIEHPGEGVHEDDVLDAVATNVAEAIESVLRPALVVAIEAVGPRSDYHYTVGYVNAILAAIPDAVYDAGLRGGNGPGGLLTPSGQRISQRSRSRLPLSPLPRTTQTARRRGVSHE